jgi:hypothetical protein
MFECSWVGMPLQHIGTMILLPKSAYQIISLAHEDDEVRLEPAAWHGSAPWQVGGRLPIPAL